jgi:hypothetical protein
MRTMQQARCSTHPDKHQRNLPTRCVVGNAAALAEFQAAALEFKLNEARFKALGKFYDEWHAPL